MSGHTPGPWAAYRTVAPRGWNIEARDGTYTVAVVRDGSSRRENTENARLIAAAPELLEALLKLVDSCDDSDGAQYGTLSTSFVRGIAAAAIAKATGGDA